MHFRMSFVSKCQDVFLDKVTIKIYQKMAHLSRFSGKHLFFPFGCWDQSKTHFPLKCPVIYFNEVFLQIGRRSIHIVDDGKEATIVHKEFNHRLINHQINHYNVY